MSVRKTRQPKPSRSDPTGATTSKEPQDGARNTFPGVWGGLTNFDQVWPELTKFDQVWPRCWLDQKPDWADRPFLRVENRRETRELWAKPWKLVQHLSKFYEVLLTKQHIWEGVFAHRFFPARNNLVRESKPLRKRVTSATTCNSRIIKSSSGQAGISIRR
jgi:hypothetical protein